MSGRGLSRFASVGWSLLTLLATNSIATPLFAQQPHPQKYETADDTNQRLLQLAEAFRSKQTEYKIGSGDVLRVDVFDVPDLSRDVQVSYTGFIALPLLTVRIQATGLTAPQLEEKVSELLQVNGLVSHPQVTVMLKERHSHPITVIGSVRKPMLYQATRETSLLEVLSEAGGITEDAGIYVIVTRPAPEVPPATETGPEATPVSTADPKPAGPQSITIKLNDLVDTGDSRLNVPLYGGETVSVPRAGIVYAVGAVDRTGGFVLQSAGEEMTVLKLIALAQGLKSTAKADKSVIIRRDPSTGAKKEINLDLKKIMARKSEDVALKTNDILFVPDSASKQALRRAGDLAISMTTGIAIVRASR
jgi:polysaccharide export outer membrane protein